MTRRAFPIFASCALLAGCGDGALTSTLGSDAGATLDARAVETGVLPNPDKIAFAGRFETRSDLGIDKFCAVKTGANRFDIGFLAVFGPESKCEGTGTASVQGDEVEVTLNGKGACTFAARYDGIELRFAGAVESGCASYCSEKASLSGTHYFMIEPGDRRGPQYTWSRNRAALRLRPRYRGACLARCSHICMSVHPNRKVRHPVPC